MADFRTIKCAMWREDDWFMDLEIDAKLFWIYLFSNPSASVAGIYRLSLRTMAAETGLSLDRVRELLAQFSDANKAHFSDGVLWVVKMREHQETRSQKVQTRILKDVALLPKNNLVYRMYATRYGIDTVSIPIPTVTVTGTVTGTETVCVLEKEPAATTPHDDDKPPQLVFASDGRTDAQKRIMKAFQDVTGQVIWNAPKKVAWLDDMTTGAGEERMQKEIAGLADDIRAGRLIPYNALGALSDRLKASRNGNAPKKADRWTLDYDPATVVEGLTQL